MGVEPDAHEGFVLDVVRAVDSRWSTVHSRAGRALDGNSEGAYAALNLSLRHPETFSVAERWSGYTMPTVKKGPFAGEPAGSDRDVSDHSAKGARHRRPHNPSRSPTGHRTPAT